MHHAGFPFHRAPNAFFMSLPKCSELLELKAFETPWGATDEILCYWNGILLGQSVHGDSGKFVRLLPTLDRQRDYAWPSAASFTATLVNIVVQFPDLEIWCEHDCDQFTVKQVDSADELRRYLELTFSFCAGALDMCPSFSYRPAADVEIAYEKKGSHSFKLDTLTCSS
jgi:hypothetical protein